MGSVQDQDVGAASLFNVNGLVALVTGGGSGTYSLSENHDLNL
jgi:hypothetical protein